MDAPLMIVLAGPNGAGKTTFYFNELEPNYPQLPFINTDIIQHREMKDHDMAASYVAANMAAERREHCLAHRQSFIWESTFSHPSKPELVHRARDAGYQVEVIHIGVQSAEICIERVAQRLTEGGHGVPEHKIIERLAAINPLSEKLCWQPIAQKSTITVSIMKSPPKSLPSSEAKSSTARILSPPGYPSSTLFNLSKL